MRTISEGEHIIGEVPGGTYIPERETLDITRNAVVHIHQPLRCIFVFNKATVHVHAPIEEIWVGGDAEVYVHATCPKVYLSDKCTAHCDAAGTLVLVTKWSTAHATRGVHVRGYGEGQIYAPSGTDVSVSSYALWHVTDQPGTVHGNTSTYRPGYYVMR